MRFIERLGKAFYILAPWLSKKKSQPDDDEDVQVLRGFLAVPVFRVEDTHGDPLDYESIRLPDIPLLEVAESWGVDVAAVGFQGGWYGYYHQGWDEIRLATPEEKTFFHELSHAAHKRVKGTLSPGQDWKQEIVAELSAQTHCYVVGTNPGATVGNSYDYISYYAEKAHINVSAACFSVLSDVEKVLELIASASYSILNHSYR